MRILTLLLLLTTACHKRSPIPTPQNSPTGEVSSVALGPYLYFSPFACRMTASELSCVATVDVNFQRGQAQYFFARGYEFKFTQPKGNGTAGVWFGCAGANECDGFFMLGSSSASATPVEPARCWCSAQASSTPPHGSIALLEVDIKSDQFYSLRPKFSGQTSYPRLTAGPGISIACTAQACTVSAK